MVNGQFEGRDAYLIDGYFNWDYDLNSTIEKMSSSNSIDFKDFSSVYLEANRFGIKLGSMLIHSENFDISKLNTSNISIQFKNIHRTNKNVDYFDIVFKLGKDSFWSDLTRNNKADVVFIMAVNNLPEYRDADIYSMSSMEYYGYLYVQDENKPMVDYIVRKNWNTISVDLYSHLKKTTKNVTLRKSEQAVRQTSYGWIFYIDLVPISGHNFVTTVSEYKTTTVGVMLKNIHFGNDTSHPTYPNLVVDVDYWWDDYYKNKNPGSKLANMDSTYDLYYERTIIRNSNRSLKDTVMDNLPTILKDLKDYLIRVQHGTNFDVGVSKSSYLENGQIPRMLFFVKPKLGHYWKDGTKDSKEFWVAFTEIRTSLPNQLIPGHSFTSTGKNDKPTQMTNPSCDYYHGMIDHY